MKSHLAPVTAEQRSPRSPDPAPNAFPIVGIGASAGGLEAITLLLQTVPLDTGLAFVCVQHLDPSHESLLPDLLARSIRMPVHRITDGVVVEPNHVYVIPANASLVLSNRTLRLAPREASRALRMPIDGLMYSLAESCGQGAIAVVLSGTGSDGALGLAAIKAHGGVTFAQDKESAKFFEMPKSAVTTGCVDFVSPPEEIARELARIGRHPYLIHADAPPTEPADGNGSPDFSQLFDLMLQATKVDFSIYRQSTIRRRIRRRQALLGIESLPAYVDYLNQTPTEVQALYQDLLIKVTQFFRDPATFDALARQVFPRLVRNHSPEIPIRIWVPGCATGEEAYSVVICLMSYLKEVGRNIPVQLFGSDVNSVSITRARLGFYAGNIGSDMPPEYLRRYFTQVDEGYRVSREIRDLCTFATHDLTKDPPYSKLDLISCRNVLIYIGSVLPRIIPLFHFALNPTGSLVLGPAESASAFSDLFVATDQKHRIYAKKRASSQLPYNAFQRRQIGPTLPKRTDGPFEDVVGGPRAPGGGSLSEHDPASAIVNGAMDLIALGGNVEPYLDISPDRATANLLEMARGKALSATLRTALMTAKREGDRVRPHRLIAKEGKQTRSVNVEVVPLAPTRKGTFLVLFDQFGGASPKAGPAVGLPSKKQSKEQLAGEVLQLSEALSVTRQHLVSVIERQAASDEMLQDEQQEAQSNIEELQSVNEQLETAKEELRSTNEDLQLANEELKTINEELQTLNIELASSRDFAHSIVDAVRDPLVVLDTKLRIKSANQSFYRFFCTTPEYTEGRPVYEIGGGQWDIPEFRKLLGDVLPNKKHFSDFEMDREFPRIGNKVLLFSACQLDRMQMILISISDVTDQKNAERALRRSEEHLRQAQKMEAMGRLAGGVAHEFNNLLMGILGFTEMLLERVGPEDPQREDLQEIKKCADRATSLTTQLLTFSRRQVLQPRVLNLNSIVVDLERMLRRLIGDHIELILASDEGLGAVRADPGQIAQIVMNLVLNARDSMIHGGTLTIETRNSDVDEAAAVQLDLDPGPYVMLSVTDTGLGIDKETQTHLFEPFFTTKAKGFGTGLGLATVHGIVEQSGAKIRFSSDVGCGTSFKIFFPHIVEPTERAGRLNTGIVPEPRGSEIIVLVEDEEIVRRLARTFLENRGYKVLEARHGGEGLAICRQHRGSINMLLTDVVMREMGGRELAEKAILLHPKMKVIFMSGYPDDPLIWEGIKLPGASFLQKPFSLQELGRKVREILDRVEGEV